MAEIDFYIDWDKEVLEKLIPIGHKESLERDGDEYNNVLLSDCNLVSDEFYFDDGDNCIKLNGQVLKGESNLGYVSLDIPLPFDMLIEIIETYRKRLAKLKNVLESTK